MEHGDRRRDGLGDFEALPDELVCLILGLLDPRDVGSVACLSRVFYILCNEEPLWMQLCLENQEGPLVYKDNWKTTALQSISVVPSLKTPLRFDGFSSLFLYRRWYRCNVALDTFAFDEGDVERKGGLSTEDFSKYYDGLMPVLLTDLSEEWAARQNWTIGHLVNRFGDESFKVSQSHGKSILMKMKDYAAYMTVQRDEEPLYIFDSRFGETAPALLEDYKVPYLFEEDLFSVLEQRPPYRWLVIGPTRSGASWHVDPALTSAWNTLLCGRKRWALYPPGRVPPGVEVHVDGVDGEVDIDGPTSLQWWLDIYPSLDANSKPFECTQLPGETIYVPSGWWHCVLNIDDTVAVTQNFVNSKNLELVCCDMAPGFHHRGVARADASAYEDGVSIQNSKRLFTADSLMIHLEKHPDHFLSQTTKDGYLNRRDLREWLRKLRVVRPDLSESIWKCACMTIDANTWLERLNCICKFHNFPVPDKQEIPVGNGSNPVYLLNEVAIKLYVHEDGAASALKELRSELHMYSGLQTTNASLKSFVPAVVASGIIHTEDDTYKVIPLEDEHTQDPKQLYWPYLVTVRCSGDNVSHCRKMMTEADYFDLASFLGKQLQSLHSLPWPSLSHSKFEDVIDKDACDVPSEWSSFVHLLRDHRATVKERLAEWQSVPRQLISKLDEYLPQDPVCLINLTTSPSWLHMDIMDDNIQMKLCSEEKRAMQASFILDFGNASLGDPLYELIPLHSDVFEINQHLLTHFLENYTLPFCAGASHLRTSYRAMCYSLLYKYDAMDVIMTHRKDLRTADSWEQVENAVWGVLNR